MQQGSLFTVPAKLAGNMKKFRQSLERQFPKAVKAAGGPNYFLVTAGHTWEFEPQSDFLQFKLNCARPADEAGRAALQAHIRKVLTTAKKYGFSHGFISAQPDNGGLPGKRPAEIISDATGPAVGVDWFSYLDEDIAVAFAHCLAQGKDGFLRDMIHELKAKGNFWWLLSPDGGAEELKSVDQIS